MTPEEALDKAISQWTLMYDKGITKRPALTLMGYRANQILNACFLCNVHQYCIGCPLKIDKETDCLTAGQPYANYLYDSTKLMPANPATMGVMKQLEEARQKRKELPT